MNCSELHAQGDGIARGWAGRQISQCIARRPLSQVKLGGLPVKSGKVRRHGVINAWSEAASRADWSGRPATQPRGLPQNVVRLRSLLFAIGSSGNIFEAGVYSNFVQNNTKLNAAVI